MIDQLSTRNQKKNTKEKLKQTNASAPLIQYRFRSVKAVRKETRVTMGKGFVKDTCLHSPPRRPLAVIGLNLRLNVVADDT